MSATHAAELPAVRVVAEESADTTQRYADSHIDAERLASGAPVNAEQIALRTVSLQMTQPDNRNTGIFLRGLGTTAFNDGMRGSVGVTVDDVYLGRQAMFPAHLYDLAGVDVARTPVLNGPGPATSVGALHVRHQQPEWRTGAALQSTLGSQGLIQHQLVANGEMLPGQLAARVSAYRHRRDGLVENRFNDRKLNNAHHDGARVQLLWQPLPDIQARLLLERTHLDENCCAYSVAHYSQASRARAAALGHTLLPADPFSRQVAQDTENRRLVDQDAATLHLNAWVSPALQLVSVTGWRDWDMDSWQDLDSIALAIAPRGGASMQHQQWSQELRLQGALGTSLDYRLGALYLAQSHERTRSLQYGPDAARWFTAGLGLPPMDDALLASVLDGGTVVSPGTESARHRALYGQLDWTPLPDLAVSAILRQSHERARGRTGRRVSGLQAIPPIPEFLGLRAALLGQDSDARHQVHDDSLDGSLYARYAAASGMRYEAGVSTGFKPGGINGETVSGNVPPTFEAEHSRSVETSVIAPLPGQAEVRVTLYQLDIRDYQALTYNPDSSPLIPQMNNIINVERVRSRGVETEMQIPLPAALHLATGAGYNDARYIDFPDAPCPPESGVLFCDLSGKRMANAPRWTAFADVQHNYQLGDGRQLYSGLHYHWRSGYHGTTERGTGSYVSSRGLLDARIGLRHARWDAALWARNLTDEDYMTAVFALNGGGDYGALAGAPRTVGASLVLRTR
ncbi:TonB-dependent receptor [Alcanivorax sp. JB21]|uniref:TonB-dependent receptor n=1 Tax=Alcanivorax limicola TaxID=2874102 RepID=UPI001CC12067|nr:TonB-dependent receptor [Alcanivorax limicola]MBZ2188858.1 TonB-dependent receptor [Alcanivorax limicola]